VFQELLRVGIESAKILLPIFIAATVARVLGDVAQVGFQFSTHPLKWTGASSIRSGHGDEEDILLEQIAMNLFKSVFKVVHWVCIVPGHHEQL
jgi:flagellar biosynthesis protein FlhB